MNRVGWRWYALWMLTFLGFPAGGASAILLFGSVDGALSGALAGGVAGAIVGAGQWMVLRRHPGVSAAWIAVTAAGLALGDGFGAAITGAGTGIGGLLVTGLVCSVAVGTFQWIVLRRIVRGAGIWPMVVAVAWPLGWTVTWAVGVDVERGYAVFGSTGALVFAAITGAAMLLVLRGQENRMMRPDDLEKG